MNKSNYSSIYNVECFTTHVHLFNNYIQNGENDRMAMRIFRSMPYLPSTINGKRFGLQKPLAFREETKPALKAPPAPDKEFKAQDIGKYVF